MDTSSMERQCCELTLVIDAALAGALIGKAGATLRRIQETSGADKIQLSQPNPAEARRRVRLSGNAAGVKAAYGLVASTVRAAGADPCLAVLEVPHGALGMLVTSGALKQLRKASGAAVTAGSGVLTCTGDALRVDSAVGGVIDALAKRETRRHAAFLDAWPFATSYDDHFETPRIAFEHVMPIVRRMQKLARRRARALQVPADAPSGKRRRIDAMQAGGLRRLLRICARLSGSNAAFVPPFPLSTAQRLWLPHPARAQTIRTIARAPPPTHCSASAAIARSSFTSGATFTRMWPRAPCRHMSC